MAVRTTENPRPPSGGPARAGTGDAGPGGEAPGARPLRRDAERNLTRILVAAGEVFAESGYEACMEEVAHRAGVGVGTLYRRFPRKEDLFAAVVESARTRTEQIAEAVLAEVEAGQSVAEFLRRCIAAPGCWRATIARPPWEGEGASAAVTHVLGPISRILGRSQEAGTVRTDLTATDLVVTLIAVRAVADLTERHAPGAARRFLELSIDAFRPGATPLTPRPTTARQLAGVLGGR